MDEIVIQIFPNMTVWKLHSFKEYLIFFLLLLSGFLFFHGWIKRLQKARTPAGAKKTCLKGYKVWFPQPISVLFLQKWWIFP